MLAAFNIITRGLATDPRRCTHIAGDTVASEATRGVGTYRILTTQQGFVTTFINIYTDRALRHESVFAKALILYAFSIVGAVEVGFAQNIDIDLNVNPVL